MDAEETMGDLFILLTLQKIIFSIECHRLLVFFVTEIKTEEDRWPV